MFSVSPTPPLLLSRTLQVYAGWCGDGPKCNTRFVFLPQFSYICLASTWLDNRFLKAASLCQVFAKHHPGFSLKRQQALDVPVPVRTLHDRVMRLMETRVSGGRVSWRVRATMRVQGAAGQKPPAAAPPCTLPHILPPSGRGCSCWSPAWWEVVPIQFKLYSAKHMWP